MQGHVAFGKMERVLYGQPAAEAVLECVQKLGKQRAFLMVSGTLNRETDEIQKLRDSLGGLVAGEFERMAPHTPRRSVIEAATAARDCDADLIITLGGGSITDGAKAVQMCLSNDVTTVEDIDRLVALKGLSPPTVRQITVPTTLSGGEFSALSGVTNEATQRKEMVTDPLVIPQAAILDPAVTVHTPEWLWLSTGIRAVDHCVEGLCSLESNPYGDAQAHKGLELLSQGLPRVKADPSDLQARLDCQLGTWLSMGPLSSGVPMGASHGIGYVLGAVFGIPHGYTSCLMLPAVMSWNRQVNADRQAKVSAAMGQPGRDAADVLDDLIGGLGLPRSLTEMDIGADKYDQIAEFAMQTPWVPRNPRSIAGPAEIAEILALAA